MTEPSREAGSGMNYARRLLTEVDPDAWAAHVADEKRSEATLAYVRRAESSGMRPAVAYWCPSQRGCLLAKVWQTPHGLILQYPPVRVLPPRSDQPMPRVGLRGIRQTPGAYVLKAHAEVLGDQRVLFACDHHWDYATPGSIREDIAATRAPRTIVVPAQ